MRPWIIAVIAMASATLAQENPGPSPTESVGCVPHGDHWHCDGPASTTAITTTHAHDDDDDEGEEATITPTEPSPTESVGCVAHGDHWHCDGPASATATPTQTSEHEHNHEDDDHDDDHDDDDDSTVTPTVPSPTESIGCEPHGDHWHCDGPRETNVTTSSLSTSASASPTSQANESESDVVEGAAGMIQVQLLGPVVAFAVGAAAMVL